MIERVEIGDAVLYLADCRDIVPGLEGIDAVISDPQYTNMDPQATGAARARLRAGMQSARAEIRGADELFNPVPWLDVAPCVVLWGYQHFAALLPSPATVLVWDKRSPGAEGTFLSDAELAWMRGGCGVYIHRQPFGNATLYPIPHLRPKLRHPHEKPARLMRWCIERAKVPESGVVLDPHMGTGTTGVAALESGRRFVGIEMDRRWFDIAAERIEWCQRQGRLAL